MNWLTKKDKKTQITTTVKAGTEEELAMRVNDLKDKGWVVLNSGVYDRPDSMSFTVNHRGTKGLGKTSNVAIINGTVKGFWSRLLSPVPNQ